MNEHYGEATLHDYADGTLPPGDEAAVAAHLATCGECRGRVERVRALTAALGALPRRAEPACDLWPGVEARTVEPDRRVIPFPAAVAPFHRRSAPSAAWQRAAAAVLLFVGGVGIGRTTTAAAGPDPALPAETPATAMEAAARVQRAGTEYVAAVAAFAALTGQAEPAELAQGREAALAAMYGAAKELTRLPSRDSSASTIYRTVSSTRHLANVETAPDVRF
ncbi:MAG TPA: zf-HC2 domain-containing protein [Longimicrobium sp.]|jgi:anti-sigma factor RsiW